MTSLRTSAWRLEKTSVSFVQNIQGLFDFDFTLKIWMLQQLNMKLSSTFFSKKSFSQSSVKTSNMRGSSAAMFLIETYPDFLAHWC